MALTGIRRMNHESNISYALQNGIQLLKKQFSKVERYQKVKGYLRIPREYGMFVAGKE